MNFLFASCCIVINFRDISRFTLFENNIKCVVESDWDINQCINSICYFTYSWLFWF